MSQKTGNLRKVRTARLLARWARVWRLPGLDHRVRVEWSPRLRRSLGRASAAREVVRLSPLLARRPRLFEAVLCHELAHIAAWQLGRRSEGPHGHTWAALVRAAGYDPSLRMEVRRAPPAVRAATSVRWIHRCPVCQFRRTAKRPVRSWRCARCVEAGLTGELVITRRAA